MIINLKKSQINTIIMGLYDAADYCSSRAQWAREKGAEATTDETRAQWAQMIQAHEKNRAKYAATAAELKEETCY